MTSRTSAIPPSELPAYEAHGWERQYDLADGRVRVMWCGQGTPSEPERAVAAVCGAGCGCNCCLWREANTVAAAYLRLDPRAWAALEEQVRERLRGVGTI